MSDVTCPECGNVLRPRPAVLIRLPGKAPITFLDYDCDQPGCAGSLRIYVTATGEARVGTPRSLGPKTRQREWLAGSAARPGAAPPT